jgi:hypothetical protein
MNLNSGIHKLETTFWESVIYLMSSSKLIQTVIRKVFNLVKEREAIWLAGLVMAWTAAGLTVGYFLGFQGLR